MSRVYLSAPHMGPAERELLISGFDWDWIAPLGPHVDGFERGLGERVGVPHVAALSSGTAAIHLGLQLLGVGAGDDVIVSTLTFSASANPIVYRGARPVFVDSDRSTWNMSPDLLAEQLDVRARRGKLPKAVIVVDLYGQCADYEPIIEACGRYEVPVLEDAAEALGATYKGKPAGSFGQMAAFSFNGNKIITTGGGGALVAHDAETAARARFLATQARDPAPHYQHSHIGYNYRLSNLLAAVGRGQLRVLDERVDVRRAHNAYYRSALSDLPGIEFMPEAQYGRSNCWLTCLTIDPVKFGTDREQVRLALEAENIESRPVWKPMHLQPVFSGCEVHGGAVAEALFRDGLCLPSGSSLTEDDRARVVSTIRKACRPKASSHRATSGPVRQGEPPEGA